MYDILSESPKFYRKKYEKMWSLFFRTQCILMHMHIHSYSMFVIVHCVYGSSRDNKIQITKPHIWENILQNGLRFGMYCLSLEKYIFISFF